MRNNALRLLQRLHRAGAAEMLQARTPAAQALSSVCGVSAQQTMQRASQAGFNSLVLSQMMSRSISSSAAAQAPVAIEGDADSVLKEIDRIVTSESAGAKEVADAAVSLAYLQAKGNRRLWGKVFEKAAAVKATFDAASLTSFLWAATTAGVGHFKTLFELSGPAAALLPKLTPAQLSVVVEALGKAGAKDAELFAKVADQVTGSIASYSGADLARLVWGFGAAGVHDTKFAKAAAAAIAGKAGELGSREAVQAVWGLARLGRADKPALDALVRAAKGKLGAAESVQDAAALSWSLAFIGYKDAETAKALSAALKTGAADLTPAHAIDAAWGLGVLGGDKDAVSALLGVASAAVEKAPDSLDVYQVASLFEAATISGAALPESVSSFGAKMHALAEEGARGKRSAALSAFKADLAEAVARGMGARYRPEITKAVAGFPVTTPAGVTIDIGVQVDASTKVAVEAVGPHYLSSAGTPLGPALARAKLLEAQGYKAVLVPFSEWAPLQGPVAKASYLLAKVKAAVPSASSKLSELQRKVEEPFDPYA